MLTSVLAEHSQPLLQWGAVLGASLAAAISDCRTRRIPNLLTGPLFAAGLAFATFSHGGAGLFESLLSSALVASPFVLLFAIGGGGAGDAKLMGALGAWLGWLNGAFLLLCVSLAGVVFAMVHAWRRGDSVRVLRNVRQASLVGTQSVLRGESPRLAFEHLPVPDDSRKMPYGTSILAGAILCAIGVQLWNS